MTSWYDKLWDFLSSGYALVIYAVIVFVIIGILIVAVMSGDRKTPNIILPDANNLGTVMHVDGSQIKGAEDEWDNPDYQEKPMQAIVVAQGAQVASEEKEEAQGEKKRFYKLSEIDGL